MDRTSAFFAAIICFLIQSCSEGFLWGTKRVCCNGVGCFDNNPPFGNLLPLPECPEKLSVSMILFTIRNPTRGKEITSTVIPEVFDGSQQTIFIVHGWLQGKTTGWLTTMKDTMLAAGNLNVIIVGWAAGSGENLFYNQAASNTRMVGGMIALVAKSVIQHGGSEQSRLYCVGHSLGAHVCGHAGHKQKFGRITGLDPAGPMFENRDWTSGLNPSCADLVDVIHTNGQPGSLPNLGTIKILGHVDFYPNGGGLQPGCVADTGKPFWSWNIFGFNFNDLIPSCSHQRAIDYFRESIDTPCFKSRYYNCTDAYSLPDSCESFSQTAVQSMGFESHKYPARGIFYLDTNSVSPYCRQ